ncbi:MAG TPA: glycosyltransferase family 39 protein [Woeseiaceae bacterium]|nr:glycosyltransferase family 39 protein [Woeseiaceae bacterium]
MNEQLFRICRPEDRATRTTWLLLLLVVAAGAVLRFWGLDNIGLHGDEDVMALATMGILDKGAPILPSGMYYPRALPQLYLMALSANAFGNSEWALRLPSAIAGTLMIVVAYPLARRYLTVTWSVGFAAVIALLPSMIALSQTARMYVFYVALVMLFAVSVFRWERTESMADYLYAVAACIGALLFHALSVFATPLFFYPGVVKGSRRLLGLGTAGFLICGIVFKLLSDWTNAQYFPLVAADPESEAGIQAVSLQHAVSLPAAAVGAAVVLLTVGAFWVIARRRCLDAAPTLWWSAGGGLFAAAVVLAFLIQYHMAAVAWFFGAVFYVRSGRKPIVPAALGVFLLGLLGLHAWAAWRTPDVHTLYDLAEALLGKPKPLPYLAFFHFSPFGVTAYALITIYFAVCFARRRPLPDHSLFFLISVFAPLFVIGFFAERYAPERYLIGLLPFFVLAVFAGVREILARREKLPRGISPAVALVTLAVFVDPSELRHNVDPQYADFPYLTDHRGVDHKGAAEYVIAQGSDADDLVIVMDSQQHGYYLRDRADYYMRSLHPGRNSSIMREGRMLNLYTGVPQIASGEQLAQVIEASSNCDEIFVVGSGEIAHNLDRYMADGIWSTMQAFGFEQSWLGRDGATRVWHYRPGRASQSAREDVAGNDCR